MNADYKNVFTKYNEFFDATLYDQKNWCGLTGNHTHCPFCGHLTKAKSNSEWITQSDNHWKNHVIASIEIREC